ncbi:BES15S03c [Trypanosoma theileri]|uniref:BES15S03c n=1 Tax=Trypanosoma theileri TaxID=67003 RepID=A0A1X0P028_9TRYP|nr:BES15S03c [Trypanosoma theileri]ORC90297.1 BES15S03c [Trypanosoma theileri]
MSRYTGETPGMFYTALTLAAFHDGKKNQVNSLTMRATSSWCQGPVPRIVRGSKESTTFFFLKTRWRLNYGAIKHQGQPHHAGAKIYPRKSLGACRHGVSCITPTRLLLSGGV